MRLPHAPGKRALWHTLMAHLWWAEGPTRARACFGATLQVDAADIVGRYISCFGVWEPNLTSWIEERLAPGDVFVDVGANVGYFTLLASSLVGDGGRVIALEPLPATNELLRGNLALNRAANVRVESVAAWDARGETIAFGARSGVTGTATLDPAWAERWTLESTITVPTAPLSELVDDDEIGRIALIKIDVEGAELRVIAGIEPLLPQLRDDAAVIVELMASALEEALEVFGRYGFRPFSIANDYSADSYLGGRVRRPERLAAAATANGADQIDVVFARSDASSL
jgi:FkbM family methyltransferase